MKLLGLIGGMSWESTVPYYRHINEAVKQRMGGLHSARLLLWSVDFEEIKQLQHAGDWQRAGELMADAARVLTKAGAEALVLCTNTMHKVAPAIESAVSVPLLHIADATAAVIRKQGFSRVGLLATRFTMEQDFYRARLESRHGMQVLVPDEADRDQVHRVIYEELCLGVVRSESLSAYRQIIDRLVARGAECIILGCTEICLLVEQQHSPVPLFDTTAIHAQAAADWAMSDS